MSLDTQRLEDRLLGDWKNPMAYAGIPDAPSQAEARTFILRTPDKASAFFLAGLDLLIQDTDPEYPALVLGNFLLGGGFIHSRLGDRLRIRDGLTYEVGSSFVASAWDKVPTWTAHATFAPQNAEVVQAAFREVLAKVRDEGVGAEEVQAAKQGWLQTQVLSCAQDGELVELLAESLHIGRSLAFQAALQEKVLALNGEEIQAILAKHLDPARLVMVKAGDFDGTGVVVKSQGLVRIEARQFAVFLIDAPIPPGGGIGCLEFKKSEGYTANGHNWVTPKHTAVHPPALIN